MEFSILVIMQCVGIVIILCEILYLMTQRPSRMTSLILMFTFCTLVNSIGYLLEMFAEEPGKALYANSFTYCGKVYIILLMFLFILHYCGIRCPKAVAGVLFLIHTAIAVLVVTNDYHHLYYSSVRFVEDGVFPHPEFSHAIFYNLFTVMTVAYIILMPIICLIRYRQISNKAEKQQLIILIIVVLIPVVGYVLFLADMTSGYDCTATGYLISSVILFYSFFRNRFFDTIDLAKDSILDNLDNGVVVLDNANKLLYTNQIAQDIFPELAKTPNREIVDYLFELVYSRENFIKNKNIYSTKLQVVYSNRMVRGKMISLNNVTDSYTYTRKLEAAVAEKTEELKYLQSSLIESLANMIEARDGITGQHVKRTSAYVKIVTLALKKSGYFTDELTDDHIINIIQAAPLHDIGKIAIPDSILQKPARLTPEEFDIIKTHTFIGANMIDEILTEVEHYEYLNVAKDVAHYHHEKWDGSGYPCGLKGADIPLAARIMAITDVFDALLSERPYKKGFSFEKSLEIIKAEAGTHFDPDIVDVFISVIDDIKAVG